MQSKRQKQTDECLHDPDMHSEIFKFLDADALMKWRTVNRQARDDGTKRLNEIAVRRRTTYQARSWENWGNAGTATSAYAVCKHICVICKERFRAGINTLGVPAHWSCMVPYMAQERTFKGDVNAAHMRSQIGCCWRNYAARFWMAKHHCIPYERTVQYYKEQFKDNIVEYRNELVAAKERQVNYAKVRAKEVRQEWIGARKRFTAEFGCAWAEGRRLYPSFLMSSLRADDDAFHRLKMWLITHDMIPEQLWTRVYRTWRFNEMLTACLEAPKQLLEDLAGFDDLYVYFGAAELVRWSAMYAEGRNLSLQARKNMIQMRNPPVAQAAYLDLVEIAPDECLKILYKEMPRFTDCLAFALSLWSRMPHDEQLYDLYRSSFSRPALARLLDVNPNISVGSLAKAGNSMWFASSYIRASQTCVGDPIDVYGTICLYVPHRLEQATDYQLKEYFLSCNLMILENS
ncbi:hypothetical protein JKP88DRAFT_241092 [Tribonema minus]|uniref:Uncharacterized protein n=1 Tax=Tribonema minus TaxID=303371 RepID=A0A835ZAC0_9STRA|nr:hypothetical protein JKP88DRAFT_241092 [Tribonema minus]